MFKRKLQEDLLQFLEAQQTCCGFYIRSKNASRAVIDSASPRKLRQNSSKIASSQKKPFKTKRRKELEELNNVFRKRACVRHEML